jgi:hypothetical protein
MKSFKGLIIVTVIVIAGCSPASDDTDTQRKSSGFMQRPDDLVAGEVMAVAYSGFREGQHPDRGDGAVNPSDDEILEDLEILLAHDFKLIRLYDFARHVAQGRIQQPSRLSVAGRADT